MAKEDIPLETRLQRLQERLDGRDAKLVTEALAELAERGAEVIRYRHKMFNHCETLMHVARQYYASDPSRMRVLLDRLWRAWGDAPKATWTPLYREIGEFLHGR